MTLSRIQSFVAGVLIANSAPHLATTVTGRRHLTPIGGRRSGPAVNAVWAAVNLAAGGLLLHTARRRGGPEWDGDLVAFEGGCLALAAWMFTSERILGTNHAAAGGRNPESP